MRPRTRAARRRGTFAAVAAVAAILLAIAAVPRPLREHLLTRLPLAPIACPSEATTIVVFGQSQATNSGERRAIGPDHAYAFHDGRCYPLRDPLPGASGRGGSVWPAFAHAYGRPVVIINGSVDGAAIEDLAGAPVRRLRVQIAEAERHGLDADLTIYMQGETDAARETGATDYLAHLRRLRAALPGRWLLMRHSRCDHAPWPPLDAARAALARADAEVTLGPQLDELGPALRRDGCHFNRTGQDVVGAAIARAARQL